MIEAYKIGVALEMTSNALPVIEKLVQQFDTLAKVVKETQGGLGALGKDFRAFATAGRSAERLVAAMDRLNSISRVGDALASGMEKFEMTTDRVLAANERLHSVLYENAKLAAELARGGGGGEKKGAGGHGFGGHDLMLTGIAASMVGAGMIEFYKDAIGKGMSIGHLQAVLAADDRISSGQIKGATDTAFATARSVPGTTAAGNLGAILDLKQVTGGLDQAVTALPVFAKLETILEAMDRRQGGTGDSVFAAAKAMEILGRMVVPDPSHPGQHMIDAAALGQAVGALSQVSVATNSRVDPAAYLAFAKQARVGGMGLDDQALFRDLPALLMVLGGSRAGTGEAATYQQFINGQMTKTTAEMMKAHHLLDRAATWKGGRVQGMSEHLVGADLFTKDPVEWARKILIPELRKEGITDPLKQAQAVASFSGRQTTAGFLGEIVRAITAIDKEAENISHTHADTILANDPQQKLRNFHAAADSFMSALGNSPAIDAATAGLTHLTDALNYFTEMSRNWPRTSGVVLDVVGGLGAIAAALGGLSTAIFLFGPALKLLKGFPKVPIEPGAPALPGGGLPIGAILSGTALATAVIGGGTLGFLGAEKSGEDIATHAAGGQSPVMVDQWGNAVGYYDAPPGPNKGLVGPWHGNVAHGDMVSGGDGVDIKADSQQGLASKIAAELYAMFKSNPIVAHIDGGEVSHFVDRQFDRDANRPPTSIGRPDIRLAPSYPAFGGT